MSVQGDNRNEVFISKRKVDTASGFIIEQTDISLKSNNESIDELIVKAKEAAKA